MATLAYPSSRTDLIFRYDTDNLNVRSERVAQFEASAPRLVQSISGISYRSLPAGGHQQAYISSAIQKGEALVMAVNFLALNVQSKLNLKLLDNQGNELSGVSLQVQMNAGGIQTLVSGDTRFNTHPVFLINRPLRLLLWAFACDDQNYEYKVFVRDPSGSFSPVLIYEFVGPVLSISGFRIEALENNFLIKNMTLGKTRFSSIQDINANHLASDDFGYRYVVIPKELPQLRNFSQRAPSHLSKSSEGSRLYFSSPVEQSEGFFTRVLRTFFEAAGFTVEIETAEGGFQNRDNYDFSDLEDRDDLEIINLILNYLSAYAFFDFVNEKVTIRSVTTVTIEPSRLPSSVTDLDILEILEIDKGQRYEYNVVLLAEGIRAVSDSGIYLKEGTEISLGFDPLSIGNGHLKDEEELRKSALEALRLREHLMIRIPFSEDFPQIGEVIDVDFDTTILPQEGDLFGVKTGGRIETEVEGIRREGRYLVIGYKIRLKSSVIDLKLLEF